MQSEATCLAKLNDNEEYLEVEVSEDEVSVGSNVNFACKCKGAKLDAEFEKKYVS